MINKLAHVSTIVTDLDEALDWYTNVLELEKREDNSTVVPGFRGGSKPPLARQELMSPS